MFGEKYKFYKREDIVASPERSDHLAYSEVFLNGFSCSRNASSGAETESMCGNYATTKSYAIMEFWVE
jgi:hypothetical protein